MRASSTRRRRLLDRRRASTTATTTTTTPPAVAGHIAARTLARATLARATPSALRLPLVPATLRAAILTTTTAAATRTTPTTTGATVRDLGEQVGACMEQQAAVRIKGRTRALRVKHIQNRVILRVVRLRQTTAWFRRAVSTLS